MGLIYFDIQIIFQWSRNLKNLCGSLLFYNTIIVQVEYCDLKCQKLYLDHFIPEGRTVCYLMHSCHGNTH